MQCGCLVLIGRYSETPRSCISQPWITCHLSSESDRKSNGVGAPGFKLQEELSRVSPGRASLERLRLDPMIPFVNDRPLRFSRRVTSRGHLTDFLEGSTAILASRASRSALSRLRFSWNAFSASARGVMASPRSFDRNTLLASRPAADISPRAKDRSLIILLPRSDDA
jgi:hypothetical protein